MESAIIKDDKDTKRVGEILEPAKYITLEDPDVNLGSANPDQSGTQQEVLVNANIKREQETDAQAQS